MTGKELLVQVNNQSVNEAAIKEVETKYGIQLPVFVQRIISYSQESIFLENDWRILSLNEILDASEDLHADFAGLKILPLIDTGDNDFIVYRFENATWAKFNIIDECFFKNKNCLDDFF